MLPRIPPKLSLAATPTPFRLLSRASSYLGGPRIWLKSDDYTGSLLSGNKVRKLEFVLADALAKGADTIITCGGLQSNHCRATAFACAQLGLKCLLILRDNGPELGPRTMDQGNLLLDQLAGAEIKIIEPKQYVSKLGELFRWFEEDVAKRGGQAYAIPTGASNGVGIWGYLSAFDELKADMERADVDADAIVCATGSGGTQAGLTLGAYLNQMPLHVVGMAVCDSSAYFARKVANDVAEWRQLYLADSEFSPEALDAILQSLPVRTIDRYIGGGYGQIYPELLNTIRWLAQTEGVLLDPVYTGKAFHGMLQEIKNGCFSHVNDIVFVHTGGVFGAFPYAKQFLGEV